jgi:hypothetical protein
MQNHCKIEILHQSETEIPFLHLFSRKTLFHFRFHFSTEKSESFHFIFVPTSDSLGVSREINEGSFSSYATILTKIEDRRRHFEV